MGVGELLLKPGVNDELAIHPQPDAIVGAGEKSIGAGREAQGVRPAHGKVIIGDRWVGRARAPGKVDRRVGADQNRAAGQILVVKVLTDPALPTGDALPAHVHLSAALILIILDAYRMGTPVDMDVARHPGGLLIVPGVNHQ